MAFGLLGSIIPQINRNEIFYTPETNTLATGKVSISSKNYNPVKIRLGITEDDINIEYLVYNMYINYGETFETEQIHLRGGQKLVARSNNSDVNFLFYGETVDDSTDAGMLNSVLSTNTQKKILYSAPQSTNVILTLSVCNLDSQPAKARIGISNGDLNAFDSSEYLEYDVEIGPNQTYTRTEIKLSHGQTLICSSSEDSNINFVAHGRLLFETSSSSDLFVPGNAVINGSVGIGTFFVREKLDVIGSGLISNNLNIGNRLTVSGSLVAQSGIVLTGIFTGSISPTSLNQALIDLGTLPSINGSALTGIVGGGGTGGGGSFGGLLIQDDGVNVGTAVSLNFADNLKASFSNGISTITTSDNVNIVGSLGAAGGKFTVGGSTGNTQIAGTLGISSSLTVSGNINALNNKVINVGSATSNTDATNKSYVDTRSIAMSIALS